MDRKSWGALGWFWERGSGVTERFEGRDWKVLISGELSFRLGVEKREVFGKTEVRGSRPMGLVRANMPKFTIRYMGLSKKFGTLREAGPSRPFANEGRAGDCRARIGRREHGD